MQGNIFKKLQHGIDINPLLKALEAKPHLWSQITERQKYAPNQVDTESIFLRWCESQSIEAAFTEIAAIDYPAFQELPEARPLIALISELTHASKVGRVLIVKLRPGGFIDKHIDEGSYAAHHSRVHLAIQTDQGCLFFAEHGDGCGEFVHMDVGEIWWFNNKKAHWLFNDTKIPRIHLIVDVITHDFEVPIEISA